MIVLITAVNLSYSQQQMSWNKKKLLRSLVTAENNLPLLSVWNQQAWQRHLVTTFYVVYARPHDIQTVHIVTRISVFELKSAFGQIWMSCWVQL